MVNFKLIFLFAFLCFQLIPIFLCRFCHCYSSCYRYISPCDNSRFHYHLDIQLTEEKVRYEMHTICMLHTLQTCTHCMHPGIEQSCVRLWQVTGDRVAESRFVLILHCYVISSEEVHEQQLLCSSHYSGFNFSQSLSKPV